MKDIRFIVTFIFLLFGASWQANAQSALDIKTGLAAALQATMNNHPAIQGKRAELEAQQYQVDGAKAARYPSMSFQANNLNKNRATGDVLNSGLLVVKQPLYAFGQIDNAIERAYINYSTEEWALLQLQRQLIEKTALAYANLAGIRGKLAVAESNISAHIKLHKRITRRQQGQLASMADVSVANSRLIQAKSQKQTLLGELAVAQSELFALTQVSLNTDKHVSANYLELAELSWLEQALVKTNAEIRYQKERIRMVSLDVKQATLSSMPTVSFKLEHDLFDQDTFNTIDDTRAGIVIEGNLEGLGFTTYSKIKSASAQLSAARHELAVTINAEKSKLRTLMINRQVQSDLNQSMEQTVLAVSDTLDSFMRQFEIGHKAWLEVLNTQRELSGLQSQLVMIKNEWLLLSLKIAAQTGALDQAAGITH